jgi:hypothetical protein
LIFILRSGWQRQCLSVVKSQKGCGKKPGNQIGAMGMSIKGAGKRTCKSVVTAIVFAISPLAMFASQQAIITWNPAPQSGISGYRIYYGSSSGNYTNMVVVGNVTNTVISGLAEGKTYYFAATSYNVLGMESGFSNEAAFNVPSGCMLSIINLSATTVAVTAAGAVPEKWALEASPDLANWSTLTRGTNIPVNVTVAVNAAPKRFFRLKSE